MAFEGGVIHDSFQQDAEIVTNPMSVEWGLGSEEFGGEPGSVSYRWFHVKRNRLPFPAVRRTSVTITTHDRFAG
ncbi:MAG: hypothetical protein KDA81_02525 [Planctomycetaceae bacterium]|nr:hypothetical protein [Planctomycetaceae bacterium]